MRILVTNDDGINAEGLETLTQYLRSERRPDGKPAHEVVVVAPDTERSGVSHALTLRHPTKIKKLSVDTYTCSGTPADCIIVAGLGILDEKPDLVISGINRGPNLGTDIIYSGTCGAARQAALAGTPAIAVSCATYAPPFDYRGCASFITRNLDALLSAWKPDSFINVNAPSCGSESLTGLWAVPGRNRYYDNLKCFEGADGYTYCFLAEGRHERTFDPLSDHHAVSLGFAAISLINLHPQSSHDAGLNGTEFPERRQ